MGRGRVLRPGYFPARSVPGASRPAGAQVIVVPSAFTLAKVIRDQQEAATVRVRLDEARIERLLADYDPLNGPN